MSVHVFVDESRRNDTYLLAAAIVIPSDLRRLRTLLRGLLLPGQRELHFKKETPQRRRAVLSQLSQAGARVAVYRRSCSEGPEAARQACLARLTADVLELNASRLALDSREDRDVLDVRTIRAGLGKFPRAALLAYEHLNAVSEPLIWIADAVAWSYGAGGDWARRVEGIVVRIVRLDESP
ncbi:hypothetical protein [Saccharothrix hoggarensis]|uniref:DUF3800 domain-containing protein n=1 Tax=Saccharothrix hoggarensis TaxID=913853 RepID=A0ABW3QTV1_9PSEU